MNAETELVEDHVVSQDLRSDPVIVDVHAVPIGTRAVRAPAVIHDPAIQLDIMRCILGKYAVADIVYHEIDQLHIVGIADIDAGGPHREATITKARSARLHDLKTPVHGPLAVDRECFDRRIPAIDHRSLTGILSHDDRRTRRAR